MDDIDWRGLFLDFDGRVNRALFWGGMVTVWVLATVNSWVNRSVVGDDAFTMLVPALVTFATFLIGIALLWPALAVAIKRWHDRGKSGWWTLILLVPIVGWIWGVIELGFLEGTNGPNEYGPDPLR